MRIKQARARRIWALLAAILLFATGSALAQEENLIVNPGATLAEGETVPSGWIPDMWDASMGASYLNAAAEGPDGSDCLHIRNNTANDARFWQAVAVEPMTLYVIRAKIRASGCGTDGVGANLSVSETFSYSEPVYETNGEWVQAELYGLTGDTQTQLIVMARLGGYSNVTTGEAWFDDIEMYRLDEIPENAEIQLFEPFTVSSGNTGDASVVLETNSYKTAILVAVLFALAATALCLYVAKMAAPETLTNARHERAFPVLLLIALAIRLAFSITVRGYGTDMSCFLSWSSRVAKVGPGAFYSPEYFCDYPPGYLYVLWVVGALRSLFGFGGDIPGAWLITKLPCVLADVFACAFVYKASKKSLGERCSLALACLYALNPAVILDSAVWGQTDGLLTLLVVLALWQAAKAKWLPAFLIYAAAVLAKPQALLFAPIGLFIAILTVVRSKTPAKEARRVLGSAGAAIAAFLLLVYPFARYQTSQWFPTAANWLQPFLWTVEKYAGTLGSYSFYTVNACNFWQLLGKNWVSLKGGFSEWAGWAAYALIFGYAFWMYAKAKNPKRVFLLGATAMALIFCFGLKMHERYMMPTILLLCMAYSVDRDIRIPIAAILISCVQFINAALVLEYTYLSDGPRWLATGTSLFCCAGTALLAWTSFDLCVREKCIGVTRIYRPSAARMNQQERQARKAAGSGLFEVPDAKIRLSRGERLVMLAVTALYSVFTLVNLGATTAPQTSWVANATGSSVTFDIGETRSFQMTYYGGICDSAFTVEFSTDAETYTSPEYALYNQGEIFRWLWYRPMVYDNGGKMVQKDEGPYYLQTARYIRITALQPGLTLSEVAFLSSEGEPIPVVALYGNDAGPGSDPMSLIDEQEIVPDRPSYYNGSYFDEIYHVRTAYEHIHGLETYEWTHPPLGKLMIALGIQLFGMTPFGWRFAGAVSGILMLPLMYLLTRQLTKNKFAAFFAMALMALDCMHFTQSRIGTIDCFAVLFILCMYLCMFRYVKMSFYHDKLSSTLVPLALCGVSFALGCATKWICIYAGVGLAILFFYTLSRRYFEYRFAKAGMRAFAPEEKRVAQRAESTFVKNTVATLCVCVAFFIAVPALVYYFSYYWQLAPQGNFTLQGVIDTQIRMFKYHSGLADDNHYFRSPWYEWPLIVKPMWYYSGTIYQKQNVISSISCMGNPAVWWGGLAGLLYVLARIPATWRKDRRNAMLAVGFFSQFAPWMLVARSTFIYHYFASVPFIILCAAVLIDDLFTQNEKLGRKVGLIWMGAALVLCAGFYPLMSGTPFPLEWARFLRWFRWYNY